MDIGRYSKLPWRPDRVETVVNKPKPINRGDLISILAPAKSIDKSIVDYAKDFLVQRGFEVKVSAHCTGRLARA